MILQRHLAVRGVGGLAGCGVQCLRKPRLPRASAFRRRGIFAGRPRCAKSQNLGNLGQTRADHGGCFFFFHFSRAGCRPVVRGVVTCQGRDGNYPCSRHGTRFRVISADRLAQAWLT